mmetsp:Transcript_9292/g.34701  ORF Transcript_9292/g.34701 Transcript_9292/m.34701 type:complete len:228 (-) Transcript_9292:194-877(-)
MRMKTKTKMRMKTTYKNKNERDSRATRKTRQESRPSRRRYPSRNTEGGLACWVVAWEARWIWEQTVPWTLGQAALTEIKPRIWTTSPPARRGTRPRCTPPTSTGRTSTRTLRSVLTRSMVLVIINSTLIIINNTVMPPRLAMQTQTNSTWTARLRNWRAAVRFAKQTWRLFAAKARDKRASPSTPRRPCSEKSTGRSWAAKAARSQAQRTKTKTKSARCCTKPSRRR